MTLWDAIALGVGVGGLVFGGLCYRELWKWAKQCQRAEIAIAYKRRVKLRATLAELVTWANALERDESATGRVFWTAREVSVSILRPRTKGRVASSIARARRARSERRAAA